MQSLWPQVLAVMFFLNVVGSAPTLAELDTPEAVVNVPASAPLPLLLRQAHLLRRMRNGDKAVQVLRLILQRRYENRAAAAMAQYELGDCLLTDFRHSESGRAELQVVIDAYSDFPELVNAARIQLARSYLLNKEYDNILPLTESVIADGQIGKASRPLVAWAVFHQAQMYEDLSKWDELNEMVRSMQENRDTAAELYIRAINTFSTSMAAREAANRLVGIRRTLPAGTDDDPANRPGWVAESNIAIASVMLFDCPPEALEGCNQSDWLGRRRDLLVQLGRDAETRGQPGQAIAWYRLSIADPARLNKDDLETGAAIGRILSKGSALDAEVWHKYLLDPTGRPDPTAAVVASDFSKTAPTATSTIINEQSNRYYWLGEIYRSQNRYGAARDIYQQALSASTTARDRGAALSRIAECASKVNGSSAGEQWASQATQAWRQALVESENHGDAHYAIEQAVMAYRPLNLNQQALATADSILEQLGADAPPTRIAFARYMRVRALAWNRRFAEAAALATQMQQDYSSYPDQDIREICFAAIVRGSTFAALAGDPAGGMAMLDRLQASEPHRHDDWIEDSRRVCNRRMQTATRPYGHQ
jgi:tetratricopeptide (TPR) repeat protein